MLMFIATESFANSFCHLLRISEDDPRNTAVIDNVEGCAGSIADAEMFASMILGATLA